MLSDIVLLALERFSAMEAVAYSKSDMAKAPRVTFLKRPKISTE